ncbi:MAG: RpiB/LacA/LacB family sugar-phosphate isomerase [Candidatus Levybacteria bacterium]|nr:RpiB/LacA/LacB family sugar-phosphate isomerase [Candidatus Levybacteria bacterium]
MQIYLASDHAGFAFKNHIKEFLLGKGYDVEDCGPFVFDKDDDYPDFVSKAAEAVSKDPKNAVGILCANTGQAEAILANKYKNVRCALFYAPAIAVGTVDVTGRKSTDPLEIINLARDHNDANMLSLSGKFMEISIAEQAVERFLKTPFSNAERHVRRIEKIKKLELGMKNKE